MEVHYDYDVNGYTVQVLDNAGTRLDIAEHEPIWLSHEKTEMKLRLVRRWAIEAALDFTESYNVDGDPIRDTSIRGGHNAKTSD